MTKVEEKLRQIAKPAPKGGWKDKVRFRNENKGWLKKSSTIALHILEELDKPEWSQARLARELGISRQMVNKIVKGGENFTLESLDKIEKVLGIQLISVLLSDEEVVKMEKLKYIEKTFCGEGQFVKEMKGSVFNQEMADITPENA